MNRILFLKGTAAAYAAIENKDVNTFYHTTDDNQLYLGSIKLSNASDLDKALADIQTNATNIFALSGKIGNLEDLTTTSKTDLVSAIEELKASISNTATGGAITIDTDTTTEGAAKSYTIKQGESTVGIIDIPKDMVVKSGTVETNPDGDHTGTFIVLTLANATEDKIYINVGTLIDIYTAKADATQVQLTINPSTREISAVIKANGITSTELADDAVITAKIADGNVTFDKLSTSVQASLNKADSAVQSITTSDVNGNIKVDGTDVAVYGLGTAAFKASTDFEEAGKAEAALQDAKDYADSLMSWGTY